MRRTETKEIDGLAFTVTQLPPRRAQALLLRVLASLSGAVGKAIAGLVSEKGSALDLRNADLDFAKMGEAIPSLFEKLTPAELEGIQKELLAQCIVEKEGKAQELWPVVDLVLDSPFTLLRVTLFAFEVNYGNFSAVLAERAQALMAAGARSSKASATSPETGRSGG